MTRIRGAYFRLLGFQVYAEFPSVTRGHRFIDAVVENRELLLWVGRFHAIITPPWWKARERVTASTLPIEF